MVLAFGWVMPHHLKDTPTRIVHVHPALISTEGGVATPSERTEVTFDPVGGRPAVIVVVVVDGKDDEHDRAEAFDDVEYRITATAAGGKDCTAALLAGHRSEERHRGLRSVRHRPAQGRRDPHSSAGGAGRRQGGDRIRRRGSLEISDAPIEALLAREREEAVVLVEG